MKHGKKLTREQKILLRKNNLNDNMYLLERDLPEGVMFVDRSKTHRLYFEKSSKTFTRLEV